MSRTRPEVGKHYPTFAITQADASDIKLMGSIHTAEGSMIAEAQNRRAPVPTSSEFERRASSNYQYGPAAPVITAAPGNGHDPSGIGEVMGEMQAAPRCARTGCYSPLPRGGIGSPIPRAEGPGVAALRVTPPAARDGERGEETQPDCGIGP